MEHSPLKTFLRSGVFLARHLSFIIAATVAGWGLWAILYGMMLAIALLRSGHLGNLLTFPYGLLAVLALTAGVGGFICLPACAVGYWVRRRFQPDSLLVLAAIFGSGYLWVLIWVYAVQFVRGAMAPHPVSLALSYLWILGLPMLIYWWFTEGPWPLYGEIRRRWLGGDPTEAASEEED